MANELSSAVCSWLKELEGMPDFGSAANTTRVAKSMNDDLARSLMREICASGARGFYEISEACETYGQLQKYLSRAWLVKYDSRSNPKKAAAKRLKEANDKWSNDGDTECGTCDSSSSHDLYSTSSSEGSTWHSRKVSFITVGTTVVAKDLKLAPALNGQKGVIREASKTGRFLVDFKSPKCRVSLRPGTFTIQ